MAESEKRSNCVDAAILLSDLTSLGGAVCPDNALCYGSGVSAGGFLVCASASAPPLPPPPVKEG